MDKFQIKCLVIFIIIKFDCKVFVTVTWHVLFEETSQVFQVLFLVLLEITAHDEDTPVWKITYAFAILLKANVEV